MLNKPIYTLQEVAGWAETNQTPFLLQTISDNFKTQN
jgi:hypothetical protein